MHVRAAQTQATAAPYLRLITELEYVGDARPVLIPPGWWHRVRSFFGSLLRDYPLDEPHAFWP